MSKNTKILAGTGVVIGLTTLVSWLQVRPLGVLFAFIFITFLFSNITRHNHIRYKIIPPPEFKNKIDMIIKKIKLFHKERPTQFVAAATLLIGTLAVIGHCVCGCAITVICTIVTALILATNNFILASSPIIVDFTWVDKYDNDLVDEFLPEVNETNRFVLDKAGDEAIITPTGNEDDKSDEIPDELMIPGTIPEINENSDTSDDDLLLKDTNNEKQNKKNEKSTAIDNNEKQQMHFKKKYFKKDESFSTSSSDEESLSKGLNFDLIDSPRIIQSIQKSQSQPSSTREQTTATGGGNTIVSNLVSGLVSWSMNNGANIGDNNTTEHSSSTTTASSQNLTTGDKSKFDTIPLNDSNRTSEDESDFEMVESDDLYVNNNNL